MLIIYLNQNNIHYILRYYALWYENQLDEYYLIFVFIYNNIIIVNNMYGKFIRCIWFIEININESYNFFWCKIYKQKQKYSIYLKKNQSDVFIIFVFEGNAFNPIEVKDDGIVICESEEHLLKALSSIKVTEDGIDISLSDEQE